MPDKHTPAPSRAPQIRVQDKSEPGKLQQQFNQQLLQIEKLKQDIAARQEHMALARKRLEKELRPLLGQVTEKRVELVKLLDAACALPFLRKREKEKLASLLADTAFNLIELHGRHDMVAYHDKYAARSFEESKAQAGAAVKDVAEDISPTMPGIDPDQEDPDNFENLQAQLDREQAQREQEKQRRQKGRKTKAQQAREAQAKAELSNISRASRRVYTALAKQLHPDTEQDEAVRAWKEEAMKKVTQAYHLDDFFELLRLQATFLQEQQAQALDALPEDQLAYYVTLLAGQVRELKIELHNFSSSPDASFYDQFCGTPRQMDQKFKQAKEGLAFELQRLTRHLRDLQDPQQVRLLLKELH